ncbi:hypothetical protein J7M23_02700 [Candidatus Sumerlaeota bacterium]|nr:hypothetical protein [Candidatus Sumerlaeota bacterium]
MVFSQRSNELNELLKSVIILAVVVVGIGVLDVSAIRGETVAEHSIAILDLTPRDPEASRSDFYSAMHCCEAMGIPYSVVGTASELTSHPLTLIACLQNADQLTTEEIVQLTDYVSNGGWLFASDVHNRELYSLFGIDALESTRTLYTMTFDVSVDDPIMAFINDPLEQTISLGDPELGKIFKCRQYKISGDGQPLAYYENGKVAMIRHFLGDGRTYVLGFRLADVIHRGQTNHDYQAERTYSNGFEPTADVLMLIIRSLYEAVVDVPLIRHTIPDGHKSALIITHDIDAKFSYANAYVFSQLEQQYGHKSTHFIETKYFSDWLDAAIYNPESIEALKQTKALGFELQSHSVGHFPDFDTFEPGDPNVTYPEYQPHYYGPPINKTTSGTIYGELKISKFLLDRDFAQNTIAFRAGHLLFPKQLPEVLEDCGYLYDGTRPANDVLQTYPYFLTESTKMGARFTNVLEIPLTISDYFLTTDTLPEVVDGWVSILERYSENFSPVVLLVHPSRLDDKYAAELELLNRVKGMDLWRGDLTTYGRFWRNRLQLQYDWQLQNSTLTIWIRSQLSKPIVPFVFKEKFPISEIRLWYNPPGEATSIPLHYQTFSRYGYRFIVPALPVESSVWIFY